MTDGSVATTIHFAVPPRWRLAATVVDSGDGVVVTLFGGDHPHVGATVIAVPRPSLEHPTRISATSTVMPLIGHKDDVFARPVAGALAARLGVVVVVVSGVHIDSARPEELEALLEAAPRLAAELAEVVEQK